MREIGIVTLLSVAATAAAPSSRASQSAPALGTPGQYAACLASNPQAASRWWIVANDRGGSIAMPAGAEVQRAYLVIEDRGARREIALEQTGAGGQQQKGGSTCT